MPNVFQKLSAQIRALKDENEELKRNPISQQRVKELEGRNEDNEFIMKQQFNYINILKQENVKLKKWLDMGEETNTKLKETIERMNADLNSLSNLIDEPPTYEEVVSNPLKIQALMRGFLTRKRINAICCVCYETCFKKNTCCNSILCGECRPRCNGKCPMCRANWNPNQPQYGMFDPLSDSEDESYSEDEEEITEVILNPTNETGDLVLYNRTPQYGEEDTNPFRFWVQLSAYSNFRNNQILRNQYRNIFYDDVPNTHQLVFTQNWMNQTLDWLNHFKIIDLNLIRDGEISRFQNRYCGNMFGENVGIIFVENFRGARSYLENIVDMPSHWTNQENSPQVYRINEEGEAYQYSHNHTGRMGSARGFDRTIGDEYLGQTGDAKARRGVHRIMNDYCEICYNCGMEFKGAIVKYHNKYTCIIQYERNIW
jgi:hypothetical protein